MSEKKDFTKATLSPAMTFLAGAVKAEEDKVVENKAEKNKTEARVKKQAVKSRIKEQEGSESPKLQEQAKEPEFHFKEAKLYRNQRVTFYLTQEIYEAMDKTCKEKGISRNEFCNVIFKEYLDGHKQT